MTTARREVVALDVTPLQAPRPAGVSEYTRQLLAALLTRPNRPAFVLLAARRLASPLLEGTQGQIRPLFPNRSLWMQFALPLGLRRLQPRVCHFTNYIAPIATRTPYIVTFHDVSLYLATRTLSTKNLLAARALVPIVARRAAAIVTVSESARQDILRVLRLPPERVRVVYSAAGPQFQPVTDPERLQRVRAKYSLPDAFILHVGTIEPRKNLGRLIDACERLQQEGRPEDLVLAGPLGWKCADVVARIERGGARSRVRTLGYVDAKDLPALYTLARVVAQPSLYEGFCLPILEAMATGIPVVTSDRSAMAEIGGRAALLVDPERTDALADGLRRVLEDDDLHARMAEAGLRRAAEFSWSRAADQMIALYREFSA